MGTETMDETLYINNCCWRFYQEARATLGQFLFASQGVLEASCSLVLTLYFIITITQLACQCLRLTDQVPWWWFISCIYTTPNLSYWYSGIFSFLQA